MALTLTTVELFELTGKRRADAQARALRSMGIEPRLRADGSVVVDREVYRIWAGAQPGATVERKRTEPRFGT